MNVFDTLSHSARRWAERPAIVDAAGSLDYQSLWREIEGLRAQLARLDVREGQGVGVRARNGRGFRHRRTGGAGMRRGGHAHPPSDEARGNSGHAGPRPPGRDSGRRLRRNPGRGPGRALWSCPAALGCGSCGSRARKRRWRRDSRTPLSCGLLRARPARPKGWCSLTAAVLERIRAANSGLGLTCEDRVLWVLPMAYHFYVSILLYLEAGATIVVSADYLAESILDAAECHKATFLYLTPLHVRMLTGDGSGRALPPSLSRVMSVSSRLDPQAARDFLARYQRAGCARLWDHRSGTADHEYRGGGGASRGGWAAPAGF